MAERGSWSVVPEGDKQEYNKMTGKCFRSKVYGLHLIEGLKL